MLITDHQYGTVSKELGSNNQVRVSSDIKVKNWGSTRMKECGVILSNNKQFWIVNAKVVAGCRPWTEHLPGIFIALLPVK